MNSILMVGDLHGNLDLLRHIIAKSSTHDLLFFGDLLDSFTFTISEQIGCVETMLDLIQRGRANCLYGNHELSYVISGAPGSKCSGWSEKTDLLLAPYKSDIKKLFSPFFIYEEQGVLCSHAGFTKKFWQQHQLSLSNLVEQFEMHRWSPCDYPDSPFNWVGQHRGGNDPMGGPLWNDWNVEHAGLENIRQIMGHTPGEKIRTKGLDYNIDCLQSRPDVLEWDYASEFKIVTV